MVRLRPIARENEEDDNVHLFVVGPKCIIPSSVAVETKLSNTWLTLLNEELKLGVTEDQNLFVCCSGFCPTAPQNGMGWRSPLTEPIKDFINKFERKRRQYRVRICFSYDVSDNQEQTTNISRTPKKRASISVRTTTSQRGQSVDQSESSERRPNIVISTDRGSNAVVPSSSNAASSSSSAQPNGYQLTRTQKHALRNPRENQVDQNQSQLQANGSVQLVKRRKVQNYTEVHIQTDIPSVPGPHVFLKEETVSSSQVLRIDNFRSVVKTECVSDYYELEDDLDDECENEEETERGNIEEENDNQDEQEQRDEEEDDGFATMSDEEDNVGDKFDNVEQSTEAKELRELGIRFEDIKSIVDRRFSGFSNAYMLRIRNEMHNLKKDNGWFEIFQRSPLCSFFIQEIFKD